MGIDFIIKIASIGLLVTVINQVLRNSGKDEYATMTNIAGAIIVVLMIAKEVAALFDELKNLLDF